MEGVSSVESIGPPQHTRGTEQKNSPQLEPRHVRFEPNIGLESVHFFFHSLQITTSFQ
jgi:hypothetical protein